jgi:hypothetical protein
MISPEEYRALWGEDNLVRARQEILEEINLPVETKEFLIKVGLPRQADLMFSFHLDFSRLPLIDSPGIYRIGSDGFTEICLDEARNACVVSIDPHKQLPDTFVNSGVLQLAECLLIYRRSKVKFSNPNLDEDQARSMVRDVAEEIKRVDGNALEGEEHWWAVIIEQMEDGLL